MRLAPGLRSHGCSRIAAVAWSTTTIRSASSSALHRKDLGIALGLADQLGASLPLAALTAALESGLIAQGHGDEDMSALARAIRQLSALEG